MPMLRSSGSTIRGPVVLVVVALAMIASSCADDSRSSAAESSDSSSASPTASPSSSGPPPPAATGLEAVAGCGGEDKNIPEADFTWQPASPPGDAQRLVLSYSKYGLHHHDLLPMGELGAAETKYHWTGLAPGTDRRYWAVLTLRDGTWSGSEDGSFPGVDCPG